MVKNTDSRKDERVSLLRVKKQHCKSLYADDYFFMVKE